MQSFGQASPAVSPQAPSSPRRVRSWFSLLVVPVLGMAGGTAYAATSYDLLVNHDAFQVGGPVNTTSDVVDAPVGGTFVYRAKSKINGSSLSVGNATLTQKLPATAIFQGIDVPGGSGVVCTGQPSVGQPIGSAVITCAIPALTSDAEVPIDFKVILPDEGTDHAAKATITALDNTDPNAGNSNDIERNITTYKRADLAVAITGPADNSTHQQGSVVNYQLQARNTNATYAFDLNPGEKATVRFSQPAGTTFQGSPSSPGNAWTCVAGTDNSATPPVPVYDCTYTASAVVPKNTNLPLLTIPVLVNASSGDTTALVSVSGQTAGGVSFLDAYPDNNTDDATIKLTPNNQLDMALVKTVAPSVVDKQGASPASVTYTLKATRNSGLLIPQGITITDTLPANVTFDGVVTPTAWDCAGSGGQNVVCTFDNAVTQNANLPDLKFKAQVDVASVPLAGGKAVLQNQATLAVANEPSPGTNNTSRADLTVTNQISLSTAKAAYKAAGGTPNPANDTAAGVIADGDEFYYEIKVHNDSDIPVQSGQTITLTDVLDGQLEYMEAAGAWSCSAIPAGWSASTPQTVTCTLTAGIAARGANDLYLKVKAHISSGQWATIANQAKVTCPANRDCATPTILTNNHEIKLSDLHADLSITKAAAVTPGFAHGDGVSGSEVVYTLKVKNAVPVTVPPANPADFQTAKTVEITDVVDNLLNRNTSSDADPVTGAPRYANNRFVEATVQLPTPTTVTADPCTYSNVANNADALEVKCTLHDVPVGSDEYTVTIKARQYVDPTSSANQTNKITNTASVSSPDTAEYDSDNNKDSADVTLTALTNMTAEKQAAPGSALAGQKIEYTLNATNKGPSKATAVKVVDTLPLGMIWVTAPTISSGTCTLANGDTIAAGLVVTSANREMTCAWTGAAATFNASNTTKNVKYALRSATVGYPASVQNNAYVDTTTLETIPLSASGTDNRTDKTVTLDQPKLNVLITMGHTNDGLPLNGQTQYTITVTNSGESTSYATNVEMMDVFPAPGSTATFDPLSAMVDSVVASTSPNRFDPSNCAFVATGLKCNFPWLAPGESAVIKFSMKATAINNGSIPVGTILHEATVSADAEYLDGGKDVSKDNTVKDRTSAYDQGQVDPADLRDVDLSIKKTVTSPTSGNVEVGGQIAYRLTVKNEETVKHLVNGNAKVVDVLPVGLELAGAAPSGCSYTAATRTLECTVTDLNAGASRTFDFTVTVNAIAPGQTVVVNKATITSLGDPVDPNNEDETPGVPVSDLDVGLVKTVNMATINVGQTLTYTLQATNHGTVAGQNVVITDTLPTGLNFLASPDGCTASAGVVTCNVGTLAAKETKTLTFTATLMADVRGTTLRNCARVQAPGDKDPANNESCAESKVPGPGDTTTKSIPVLDNIGLALMALLLMGFAGTRLRRRP